MRKRRELTTREIKQAICTHDQSLQVRPTEHRAEWGGSRTTLACTLCGHWTVRELRDVPGVVAA